MGIVPLLALFALVQTPTPKVRGTVLDFKGKPRVGAEVILTSPGLPLVYKTEVLRTKTDKRGRFHLRPSLGRVYSAWSHFKDAKGLNHLSSIQANVQAGKILILREKKARSSKRVKLNNLAAWGKPEALQVVWNVDGKGGFLEEASIDGSAQVKVPDLMPLGRRLAFELHTKTGQYLYHGRIFTGKKNVAKSLLGVLFGGQKDSTQLSFRLPKPVLFPVLVQEEASNKPIAGAKVFYRYGSSKRLSQVETNEKGRGVLKVPEFRRTRYPKLSIFVTKKGFAGSNAFLSGASTSIQGKWEKASPKKPIKEIVFSLGKDSPFTGKVLGLDGKGLPGAVISWSTSLYGRKDGNSTWGERGRTGSVQTGLDGSFTLSSIPPNLTGMEARLYLPPSIWETLQGQNATFALPTGALMKKTWRTFQKTKRTITFDFSAYHILPFRVLGPDGAPAPFLELHWRIGFNDTIDAKGGRRGKGFLLVPKGRACLFGVAPNLGYFIDAAAEAPEDKDFVGPLRTITLKKPETFLAGRVVDKKGNPLPFVKISPGGWSISGGDPRTRAVQEINYQFLRTQTDKKGAFRLPFLEDSHLQIRVNFSYKGLYKTIKVANAQDDLKVELK